MRRLRLSSLSPKQRQELQEARRHARNLKAHPEIPFQFTDEDELHREISEFYSYAENAHFDVGCTALEGLVAEHLGPERTWSGASADDREDLMMVLLDMLEQRAPRVRHCAAHALLYLLQGVYNESSTVAEQEETASAAAGLLYACNGYPHLVRALCLATKEHKQEVAEGAFPPQFVTTPGSITADTHITTLLNVLFTLVMRIDTFPELASSLFDGCPLSLLLLGMVSDFNDPVGRWLPIKKILLLLSKCLLRTLGGRDTLRPREEAKRAALGLPPRDGDTPSCHPGDVDRYEATTADRFMYHSSRWAEGLPFPHQEALAYLRTVSSTTVADAERDDVPVDDDGNILDPPPDFVPRASLPDDQQTHFELLYRLLLPNMSRYIIIVLKILLAAAPTVKNYTGSICLTSELAATDPQAGPSASVFDKATASVDAARHREIVVKAASSILDLILVHARLNHIYQFEYVSHLLVDANCILLILKFLNQDVNAFISAQNHILELEFMSPPGPDPASPMYSPRTATGASTTYTPPPIPGHIAAAPAEAEAPAPEAAPFSWRNFHSTVRLLNVLAMLTQDNGVRIRQLIKYKAPAILKRLLPINHPHIKVLTLSLIKRQIRHLGRKWRPNNMHIVSQIYTTLGPDLDDTWLYNDQPVPTFTPASNTPDTDTEPLLSIAGPPGGVGGVGPAPGEVPANIARQQSQQEDFLLRQRTDVFNQRNYQGHA